MQPRIGEISGRNKTGDFFFALTFISVSLAKCSSEGAQASCLRFTGILAGS